MLVLSSALVDEPEIEEETRFDELTQTDTTRRLEALVDQLSEASDAITDPATFQAFQSLIKHADHLPQRVLLAVLDVLPSSFEAQLTATARSANPSDHSAYQSHKPALECYAYLLYKLVQACEKRRLAERGLLTTTAAPPKSKAKGTRSQPKDAPFDWANQIPDVLNAMLKALGLKTEFVWPTSQDRDAFVSCFTKSVYQILECKLYADTSTIRVPAFKIICTAAKSHGQAYNTQTSILQSLQYFDHLAEPMAELVHLLVETRDMSQLADAVLRSISSKTFTAQDQKSPRPFSRFLIRLAQLSPRLVARQIAVLQKHLDSDSYVMRIALLEVFGKLICALSMDDDDQGEPNTSNEQTKEKHDKEKEPQSVKLDGFFGLLFDRFCDSNTFVRLKVVSIFEDILKLPVPFPKHRLRLASEAVRSLEDKSSQVRKHCIAVLSKLIETHPYGLLHGGELALKDWEARHEAVVKDLSVFDLADSSEAAARALMGDGLEEGQDQGEGGSASGGRSCGDGEDGGEEEEHQEGVADERRKQARRSEMTSAAVGQHAALSACDNEGLMKLRLTKRYYADAIQFVQTLESALPQVEKLLASRTKSEVLEAIYFFKVAFTYKLSGSENGIKRMLHLVWTSDNSSVGAEEPVDESGVVKESGKELKGIRSALVDCYQELYFASLVRVEGESVGQYASRNIDRITRNMIELTYQPSLAELTSLEELMGLMMERGYVHEDVVGKLWEVYSTTKDIARQQRRGAILVLGMLAAPRPKVVADNLDKLIAIGLGPLGKADLVLAKYSCMALTRIGGSAKKVKGSLVDRNIRLPMDNPVFHRLVEVIEVPTRSKEWFAMTEQALNTIYALADQPDTLASEILKSMTIKCFEAAEPEPAEPQRETEPEPMEVDAVAEVEKPAESAPAGTTQMADTFRLSQVMFIAGHAAVKQLVHLELVEREFKRRKAEAELQKKGTTAKQQQQQQQKEPQQDGEELDQVAGNVEDEIGDVIGHAKEKELLYGHQALLGIFGPMAVQICGLPSVYKNETLRTAAVLALGKFMCVSAEFCDQHLMLLFKILETSKSPTIRSNIIIALGDIAVCFATIIDQHSDGLYRGLADDDLGVKKNTLMVLTHLILNGMIKVKGQLGEIAKCVEDEDKRISDLAQLFFDELSKKDQNAIYNNLPDMISHLSVGKHAVDSSLFRSVMDRIFKHLKKDKQSESIVEKLCQRFRLVSEVRQWQDIAYCLSLLQFKSEKALKKLVDGLPFYQDKLYEPEVFKSFEEILAKVKANKWAKDHGDLVEFEKGLRASKEKGEEDAAMEAKVAHKQKKKRAAGGGGGERKQFVIEEEDDEEGEETVEDARRAKAKGKGKAKVKGKTTRRTTRRRDLTPDSD